MKHPHAGRIANAALLVVLSFTCRFAAAVLNGWYEDAWDLDFVVLALPWSIIPGHARPLCPLPSYALTWSIVIVAAPLLWVLAGLASGSGSESPSVLFPMITVALLALAIGLGTRRVRTFATQGAGS